jgi:hypothetical protein
MKNPLIHQADIILEREIGRNTAVSISYLFSRGRNLPTFVDENLPTPIQQTYTFVGGELGGSSITVPFFQRLAVGNGRPDTRFGAITQIRSDIESKYDGLVLQANRRLTKGLQFQTHYTFSRARDNGQNSQTFSFTQGRLNPFDDTSINEEGPSNNDVPHRFVFSAVWTPGAPFGLENSRVGRAIFGGFTIAPIFVAQSGNVYTANFSGNVGNNPISGGLTGSGGLARVTAFERNSFRQPKLVNLDLRISRRFRFTETMNLEVLAEGFNIFNRYQVTGVNNLAYSLSGNTLTSLAAFGQVNAAGNSIYRERQIQFAVRFQF